MRDATVENNPERAERILVQHELEGIREVISAMLTAAHYECRAVTSPAEVWDSLLSGESYDLALCNLAQSLEAKLIERVVDRFPDIPMITLGARPLSMFLEGLRRGAYDYIRVPFEREQLLAVVRRALEYRRLKLENRANRHQLGIG